MSIRNTLIAAGSALALCAVASGASAAGTVSATANASVTVVAPTAITKTQDMAFGTVVRPDAGTTTVALDTSDHVTATGGTGGATVASPTSSAKFNITVQAATTYSLTQSLSFLQPGLTNVAPTTAVATTGTLGSIPAAGTQEIRYGGQFDMTAATTPQTYTGTLSVTVTYNKFDQLRRSAPPRTWRRPSVHRSRRVAGGAGGVIPRPGLASRHGDHPGGPRPP
jgi:hypothetical protein